ncbi:MAG TPA: hypothetical protein VLA88_05205 [Candidatus Saccharimonadales bacterium]|nr:hypothetical protein [Candidatus Saccharimonadales bacterium]
MKPLETKLDEWLVKKAPFQIPESGRKGLVEALPWLTLIGGVLMLGVAWSAYQILSYAMSYANRLADTISGLYGYLAPTVATYSPMLWVSLVLLLAEAVLFFVAFPALRERKKSGWNILFWVSLVNIANGVVQFIAVGDFGQLIGLVLGSVIGLYLLFQVRGHYTGEVPVAAATKTGAPTAPASPATPAPSAEKPAEIPAADDKKPEEKV